MAAYYVYFTYEITLVTEFKDFIHFLFGNVASSIPQTSDIISLGPIFGKACG